MKDGARIDVPALDGDDIDFIHLIRATLADELVTMTDEAYLVKVDRWFGRKWFRFSGKVLGALAIWRGRVTVPPFHPNRVVFERHFTFDHPSKAYSESTAPHTLHIRQGSEENLKRGLHTLSSSGTFVWYSGDTEKTGRGSLMVYVIAAKEHFEWYAELVRMNGTWRMTKPVRIPDRALRGPRT